MLWLRTGKGTAQHVAPIKDRRMAFNTVNMENQQGSGVKPLTNNAYATYRKHTWSF